MSNEDRYGHLPQRIAESHHASGPFSFLNPTTRYVAVPTKNEDKRQTNHRRHTGAGSDAEAHLSDRPRAGANTSTSNAQVDATNRIASSGTADLQQTKPDARHPASSENIEGAYQIWRSRDNRKGRHAIVVSKDFLHHRHHGLHGEKVSAEKPLGTSENAVTPPSSDSWRGIAHILWKMVVHYPIWDVSYDVAMIYTLGSVIWVINSFFVWLPLAAPWTEFANEEMTGGGVTAVVGATVFEVGAILGVLEAVNENRADCFGWALESALESGMLSLRPNPEDCKHAHVERTRLFTRRRNGRQHHGHRHGHGHKKAVREESTVGGAPIGHMASDDSSNSSSSDMDNTTNAASTSSDNIRLHPQRRKWVWCPSWMEVRTIYAREMGFWACVIQLFGATIFWISGFTGLPPIANRLSTAGTNGAYWAPQVIGGCGFIISSLLFMFETQSKWYLPAPRLLGWHIGFWNLVGAIGFTLCGALGFGAITSVAVSYASCMSTFVGSWAFLIGSVIQWYESLDKHPIQIQDSLPDAS